MKLLNEARLRAMMERADLDCVVFAAPASTRYAAGTHSWLDGQLKEHMVAPAGAAHPIMRTFVVFPAKGEAPGLIVNSGLAPNAQASWIADVHVYGQRTLPRPGGALMSDTAAAGWRALTEASPSAVDALCDALAQRNLSDGRIGVESDGVDAATMAEIRRRVPKAWIGDCSALIRLVRMVKTPSEITLLARAAQIAEDAAISAFGEIKPGASWLDVAGHFRRLIANDGAEFDHFAYGLDGIGLATAVPATIGERTCACVDFGCIYEGYFSDSAATVSTELPSAEQRGVYQALLDCVDAGIASLQPGVVASAVQAAMAGVVTERGIVADPPTGHGLGLAVRDWPILVPDSAA